MCKCFVVCPIGSSDSPEREKSDRILNSLIIPACKDVGLSVERSDLILESGRITDQIYQRLRTSEMVISLVDNENRNVFFETGYRFALQLPMVFLYGSEPVQLPFDLADYRVLSFDASKSDLSELVPMLVEHLKSELDKYDWENGYSYTFANGKIQTATFRKTGVFYTRYQLPKVIKDHERDILDSHRRK